MPTIHLDAYVSIHTDDAAVVRYNSWIKKHPYGPYTLTMEPTGVNTALTLLHVESGRSVCLTDYENV